jgi:hypothetical protein
MTAGKHAWGTVTRAAAMKLFAELVAKEESGEQMLGEFVKSNTQVDYLRVERPNASHVLENFKYNHIVGEITADVRILPTAHGAQLAKFLEKSPERIEFIPVYLYDDASPDEAIKNLEFITVNAVKTK